MPGGRSFSSDALNARTLNTSFDDSTKTSAGAAVIASSNASESSDTIKCECPSNLGFRTRVFMERRIFTSPSPGTRVPLISKSKPFGSALRLSSRVAA